jgi:hypothetical protein
MREMRKLIMGMALVLCLSFAALSSAATVPVTSLSGGFGATNSSVRLTPEGVNFGVDPDAGLISGSLYYGGFNGRTLDDIASLSYLAEYNARDALNPYAVPYLRARVCRVAAVSELNGASACEGALRGASVT